MYRGKEKRGPAWVKGDKVSIGEKVYILPDYCNELEHLDEDQWQIGGLIEVHPDSVGMWTGLKDKNGVEIYEGDIVEYIEWFTDEDDCQCQHFVDGGSKGVVIWNDEFHSYLVDFSPWRGCKCTGMLHANKIRYIVGDIHSNPDMIKGGFKTNEPDICF